MLFNLFSEAQNTTATTGCNNAGVMTPILIVVAVLFVGAMIVYPMISRKRNKKNEESRVNSLSVGDTIETVGGIIGVVKEIKDYGNRKELIIQSGDENGTTLSIDIKALYLVLNKVSAPACPVTVVEEAQTEPFTEETGENADKEQKTEEKDENSAN
ncbi:MAG: preprotein translocase subunit YajC [Clostridia bacterium]|nr:preprotein translocase subunit YajC [Clostridia bacterium]